MKKFHYIVPYQKLIVMLGKFGQFFASNVKMLTFSFKNYTYYFVKNLFLFYLYEIWNKNQNSYYSIFNYTNYIISLHTLN